MSREKKWYRISDGKRVREALVARHWLNRLTALRDGGTLSTERVRKNEKAAEALANMTLEEYAKAYGEFRVGDTHANV